MPAVFSPQPPDAVEPATLERALVIKLRHHGDVLLTSPVFTALADQGIEADALVYMDTADMLRLHPGIAQVHTIDRGWKKLGLAKQAEAEWRLLQGLKARRFDLVVHLTNHLRGAWYARLLAPKVAVGMAGAGRGRFWQGAFTHLFPTPANRHTVEHHLDALRRLGIQPREDGRCLVLVPGQAADAAVEARLVAAQLAPKKFIHIHPGSRWLFKCWPPDKTAALVRQLHAEGHAIALTAAPDARELGMVEHIKAAAGCQVVDFSGQLTLKEMAALTARARLFVGVDSAPMHIAVAMGTPTVALFGPSNEKLWGPWQSPARVPSSTHSCRPCGLDGCGGGKYSECLAAIEVAEVLAAARALLDGHGPTAGNS